MVSCVHENLIVCRALILGQKLGDRPSALPDKGHKLREGEKDRERYRRIVQSSMVDQISA
jgi:hypothetical protein